MRRCCILRGPGGKRIVDIVPGGTDLELQLRRGAGQAAHTRNNPHVNCTGACYNWINELSNTTFWWLDICCLLHRYQLHVSALMAIFRLID